MSDLDSLIHAINTGDVQEVNNLLFCNSFDAHELTTAFALTIVNNEEHIAEALIREGIDVDTDNEDGETVLMHAAKDGKLDRARLLVSLGANIDAQDRFGQTSLMLAAENGHLDMIDFLVGKGADIELKTDAGRTALSKSLDGNNVEATELLINLGADINGDHNYTPLMSAAILGKHESVLLLLASGADAGIINSDGNTAYDVAMGRGQNEVASIIKGFIEQNTLEKIIANNDQNALTKLNF